MAINEKNNAGLILVIKIGTIIIIIAAAFFTLSSRVDVQEVKVEGNTSQLRVQEEITTQVRLEQRDMKKDIEHIKDDTNHIKGQQEAILEEIRKSQ